MKRRKLMKYRGVPVCKADYDSLIELDIAKTKLDKRLELAIKTLADLPADSNDRNTNVIQQFIDKTYINSVNSISEAQQSILNKYPVPEFEKIKFYLRILTVCISALLVFSLALLSADTRKSDTKVYISQKSNKYHTDYYCSSLTGIDKSKGTVSKKSALEEKYSPCANCCR